MHLVHLAEKFDDDAVGVLVIDRDVMADDVTHRPPGELDLFFANRSLARLMSDQSRTSNAI